jgi:hypothetical protein
MLDELLGEYLLMGMTGSETASCAPQFCHQQQLNTMGEVEDKSPSSALAPSYILT